MAGFLSLPIDSIAAGGDGVGRSEGLVVFVPRTAPGDVVNARITGKGRFARGALISLEVPSAERVTPPCTHYTRDRCGGCQIQHLSYAAQLRAKRGIVADAVQRIAKRDIGTLGVITPSPNEWRYRTKLTLAIRGRGAERTFGLHRYDRPTEIFQLQDCPITESSVVETWKEIMAAAQFLPDSQELRGSVRVTSSGATFLLYGGARWPESDEFLSAVPSVQALWWEPDAGGRRLMEDRREKRSPDASFGQVNPPVAALLHRHLIERVKSYSPATVVDAYSGSGDTAAELASAETQVSAIELDPDAAEWASRRLAAPSRSMAGRVEDLIGETLPADVVIVNPPRAGIDQRVSEALNAQASAVKALFYVSCDPATLARDLARLSSYRIASLQPFDMFPQTAHVETVCEMVPA